MLPATRQRSNFQHHFIYSGCFCSLSTCTETLAGNGLFHLLNGLRPVSPEHSLGFQFIYLFSFHIS